MNSNYTKELQDHFDVLQSSLIEIEKKIYKFMKIIEGTVERGNKIIIFGNGGSASDSIHFAAELSGKFRKKNRKPLPAISLSENISTITAVGNDFQFSEIFSRQVQAIGQPNDLAIGITTSGESNNVIKALSVSKKMGLNTSSLIGSHDKLVSKYSKLNFKVNSLDTARVQEIHILFIHLICSELDKIY